MNNHQRAEAIFEKVLRVNYSADEPSYKRYAEIMTELFKYVTVLAIETVLNECDLHDEGEKALLNAQE
jgi:hypothetical protein